MASTHPTTGEAEFPSAPAPQRSRYNFTMADMMLAMLLFGGQLSVAKWWLDVTHFAQSGAIILLAVLSALAAAGALLFVSSTPHGRKTWPLRWMFMITLDGALFVGIPCLVILAVMIVLLFPITLPIGLATRDVFTTFWRKHEHVVTRDVGEAIEIPDAPGETADA